MFLCTPLATPVPVAILNGLNQEKGRHEQQGKRHQPDYVPDKTREHDADQHEHQS